MLYTNLCFGFNKQAKWIFIKFFSFYKHACCCLLTYFSSQTFLIIFVKYSYKKIGSFHCSALHTGHVGLAFIHSSIQFLWNKWSQFSFTTLSYSKASKQTAQLSFFSSAINESVSMDLFLLAVILRFALYNLTVCRMSRATKASPRARFSYSLRLGLLLQQFPTKSKHSTASITT